MHIDEVWLWFLPHLQALCKAEDESDAMAATLVKAEQKAELAEFDETIPWDEREAEARKEEEEMSRAEMELAMLDKEVRGAVVFQSWRLDRESGWTAVDGCWRYLIDGCLWRETAVVWAVTILSQRVIVSVLCLFSP